MRREDLSVCMDKTSVREILKVIVGDLRPSENRASWLWRAAEVTGLHYRVVRAIWYREAISWENAFKLRRAVKKNDDRIVERLLSDAETLNQIDPAFYRDEIDYRKQLADEIRRFSDQRKS
jgi:hypothetical protein